MYSHWDMENEIREVQEGNREAYASVVHHCESRLRAFIFSSLRDDAVVDDILQQTFLIAFKRIHEFTPGTNIFGWLKGIAYNMVRTHRKREWREAMRRQKYAQLRSQSSSRAHKEEMCEQLLLVQKCLSELNREEREFIKAAYARNSSLKQMAKRLQRSPVAVRQQLCRLRKTIRANFERQYE